MARQEILDRIQKYVHPFRVTKGKGFQLKDFDPGDTRGLKLDKGEAADLLQAGTAWLAEEQDMLYAQNRWSLLLVFQAMDAAGKDSTIKHVMSGVNPQGCQVVSFKQPSSEDLDHDFMWRSRGESRGFAQARASSIPARTGACKDSPAMVRVASLAECRAACPEPRSCVSSDRSSWIARDQGESSQRRRNSTSR